MRPESSTCAIVVCHFCYHLPLLCVTFSAANVPNCSSSSAAVVFYSSDFWYHRLSLLPSSNADPRDFLCCQRFQLLSSSSSAAVIFYSSDFCYHRLSLLPSSNTATCEYLCCHHLTLLRVTFSAADVSNSSHRLLLPSYSMYSCDFCGHRLLLLPSSDTAPCDFLCCRRFQLQPSSSAAVVFYSSDFCYHRLSLLPPSNTASCDIFCCSHRILRVAFSAADIFHFCRPFHCYRHLLLSCAFYHRVPLLLLRATIVRLPSLSSSSFAAAIMTISKEIPFAISDRPSSK
ncbi:hypothetical protein CDAR_314841 [Caerostris darwini]|uniref:Uncharacterized protein n=1 Tax=Caerostris darwini TaxID=1538125 RepID=A0AAV4TRT8_9ARAC|nr:hypothetical protein CDAR_314841 [Caerostris darwini]